MNFETNHPIVEDLTTEAVEKIEAAFGVISDDPGAKQELVEVFNKKLAETGLEDTQLAVRSDDGETEPLLGRLTGRTRDEIIAPRMKLSAGKRQQLRRTVRRALRG